MAVKNRIRSSRFENSTEEKGGEGKFFLKLIICAALVCGFMLVKDIKMPSGMTVSQFVTEYIETNTHLNRLADRLRDAAVPVFGNSISENTPGGGD